MNAERHKALRSRPFYGESKPPFTSIEDYEKDASNAIARGALLSGDVIILNDLKRSGNVYYWLPIDIRYGSEKFNGIAHRFNGIREDGKRIFTRLGNSKEVSLGKRDVNKLIIQHELTKKQIQNYGYLYGVPEKVKLSNDMDE